MPINLPSPPSTPCYNQPGKYPQAGAEPSRKHHPASQEHSTAPAGSQHGAIPSWSLWGCIELLQEVQGWLGKVRDRQSPGRGRFSLLLQPHTSMAVAEPWAPSQGATCPRSSEGGAGTSFIHPLAQAVSHHGLKVQPMDLCTSVPLPLPSHGTGGPRQHLGVQLGAVCLSPPPHREHRQWGAAPLCCPRASPPAPRGGTQRSSQRSQCCSQT